jgi:16S rRNA (cytosine1402-N4)-methyltransferase
MIRQVLEWLLPSTAAHSTDQPRTVIDCTLGRGGHARLIADALSSQDTLLCIDRDPRNLEYARKRFSDAKANVRFFEANFSRLSDVIEAAGVTTVDGIFADLGISTNQLFEAEYGLSFQHDGPLDMRLTPDDELSAYTIINRWDEETIANTLYELADERFSRRIARKIVEVRQLSPITSSGQLADLVRSCVPRASRSSTESIDPATRTFLALRMKVNREAENLEALLKQAPTHLSPHGRLVVISFHSTEDRIVKNRFRDMEATGVLNVLTKKPLVPDEAEIEQNPRARSSKMRVAEKV